VLIVGAGPTGLTAALEISRMGIAVRIVDDEPARAIVPPGVVMGSQTLELLLRRGCDQELIRGANQVTAGAVYEAAGLVGKVPLTSPPGRHHHSLLVPQAETEQVLRHQLAQQGVAVEHATELIAFAGPTPDSHEQCDEDVRCILRHHDGRLEEITVPYLISADGTFGTVRQKLDPPRRVKHARRGYVVADLELDGDLPVDDISIFLGRRGFVALFPLRGDVFRCVATDPHPRFGSHGQPAMDELKEAIATCSPIPGRLRSVRWSCRVPSRPRTCPVLRHGRVFFGGDSAHGYSPVSGQGLDSGIEDVINLSWKLAMVLRGQAVPELLLTYSEERLPVIRRVERSAEWAADLLGTTSAIARQLVTRIAPAFLDSRFVLRLCADLIGEFIPDYRQSSLSGPGRGRGSLQPGDSVPDIRVLAHDAEAPLSAPALERSLRELVNPSRLTLLFAAPALSAQSHPDWRQLEPWRGTIAAYRIAPVANERTDLFSFIEAFGRRQGVLLARPDSYVGFAGGQHATGDLARWLSRWFPAERAGRAPSQSSQSSATVA
jgi:2-polyprenyl-6-methoxyphenol hydroxylase-like FAD-dependent oxidoreductase